MLAGRYDNPTLVDFILKSGTKNLAIRLIHTMKETPTEAKRLGFRPLIGMGGGGGHELICKVMEAVKGKLYRLHWQRLPS